MILLNRMDVNFPLQEIEARLRHKSSAGTDSKELLLEYLTGLQSEVGEVSGIINHSMRKEKDLFSEENIKRLHDELGDVLFYVGALLNLTGTSIEEIYLGLFRKLDGRGPNGLHHDNIA